MRKKLRTYRELNRLYTFEERFEYLKLGGEVGAETFGFDRWLNQDFYHSFEWKSVRAFVIARDLGCDLGVDGYEIHEQLLVHHINPITPVDLRDGADFALDMDNLITTCHQTHNALHYGMEPAIRKDPVIRRPGDTKLW